LYKESFSALLPYADQVFSGEELRRFNERVAQYQAGGASREDATTLSLYRRILQVLEILWCAREYKRNVNDVARAHAILLETLNMGPIFKFEKIAQSSNAWERELAEGAYHEIRRSLSNLAGSLLSGADTSLSEVTNTLSPHKSYQAIRSIMADVNEGARLKQPFAVSALPLLARHLRALCEALRS
jgi:NAD-specific glutamate dehydrogenase